MLLSKPFKMSKKSNFPHIVRNTKSTIYTDVKYKQYYFCKQYEDQKYPSQTTFPY